MRHARHARSDYDAIQPWPTKRTHTCRVDGEVGELPEGCTPEEVGAEPIIPDDEPVFIVRAQDKFAPATCDRWADLAEAEGLHELADAVRVHADLMRGWQRDHGAKAPDVPEGALRYSD